MDEDILNRQMPQSMEAEQAVLGAILIDSSCLKEVVGILKPNDFYLRQNREIYDVVYSMFNFSRPIDPVTVLDELKQNGHYEEGVTYQYVSQLMSITPTASNAVRARYGLLHLSFPHPSLHSLQDPAPKESALARSCAHIHVSSLQSNFRSSTLELCRMAANCSL